LEQSEIEAHVEELETRVDRLRSLYEQYFMGIEKIEPGVAKKDVERRFQVLRREQIRNTALRFRFQMVVQRYNTYQSYWIRVCRQIEEGTYKRDVLSAQRRDAAKRRTVPPAKEDARRSVPSDDEVVMELDSGFLQSVAPPAPNNDENEDFLPLIVPQRKAPAAAPAPAPVKAVTAAVPAAKPVAAPAAPVRPAAPAAKPAAPAPVASGSGTRRSVPPRPTPGQAVTPESREEKMRQLAAQIKAARRTGPGTPSQ
jgi:hypothetical protein